MSDIEIEVKVVRFTEKALLVDFGGKDPVWIPTSQVTDYSPGHAELHNATSVFIPEWLAREKGMV